MVDTVDSKFYNTEISYGLMDVTNMETGQELHYFYIVDELQVDSLTIGESAVAYNESDAAPKVASTKSLYTAFFIDSTAIMAEINGVKQDILRRSLVKMALVMTVATIILVILGQNRARSISDKMTKQVITLYENLLQISSNKAKGSLTLSYVPASAEMNELNLTYNQFAKIISLATTFEKHNSEKALLNYFEALGIFADFEDYDQQGKCLTNIGAIMMQKEDYGMAYVCFSESIEFMEKDQFYSRQNREARADNEEDKFLLACRLFQKGLANMELFRLQFPNSALLASKDDKDEKIMDFKLHYTQSSSRYQKHLPKGLELKLKKMTEDRDLVNSIKADFLSAIKRLNVR